MMRIDDLSSRGVSSPRGLQTLIAPVEADAQAQDFFLGSATTPGREAWEPIGQLFQQATPLPEKVYNASRFEAAAKRDWLQRDYGNVAQRAYKAMPSLYERARNLVTRQTPQPPTLNTPSVIYAPSERRIIVREDRCGHVDKDDFFLPMLHAAIDQAVPAYLTTVKSCLQEADCNAYMAANCRPRWKTFSRTRKNGTKEYYKVDINEPAREQYKHATKVARGRAWSRLGWLEAVSLVIARAGSAPDAFRTRAFDRCLHEGLVDIAAQSVYDGDVLVTFQHPELVDALSYAYTQLPLRVPYGQRECAVRDICRLACKALPDTFSMPGFEVEEAEILDAADPKKEPLLAARQLLAAGPSQRGLSIISQYVDSNPHAIDGLLLWADTIRYHMPYPDAARSLYERVLRIDPTNNGAREGLASLAQTPARQRGPL